MSLNVIKEAKMTKKPRLLIGFILILAVAFVLAGCGSSKKEPGAEEDTGISTVGFTECYNCHSAEQNPSGLLEPFGWHESRHFNANDDPAYPLADEECAECHNELGDGDLIEDFFFHTDDDFFGTENRNIVACESCHGPGGNHFGIGPLGNDLEAPGVLYSVCATKCHANPDIPSDHATSAVSDRVITDSHFDDPDTVNIEGYVLNPQAVHNDLPGNENNGSCIDCHEHHTFDITINEQWAASAHAGHFLPAGIVDTPPFADEGHDWKAGSDACKRCHTATGFRDIANDQDNYVAPAFPDDFVATGLQQELIYCWACHYNNRGGLRPVTTGGVPGVIFPSGAVASLEDSPGSGTYHSHVCMLCHQGRESGVDVQEAIDSEDVHRFINIHYYAAAATLFGSEVNGGYEYPGKTYVGRNTFPGHTAIGKTICVGCHMRLNETEPFGEPPDHHFLPELTDCNGCHTEVTTSFEQNRGFVTTDYDGDGNTTEGLRFEVLTLENALLAAIQNYAENTIGTCIAYDENSYPYYFVDANCNGVVDADEEDRYELLDDTLLPAAYNLQVSKKEPGGCLHNHRYVIQLLIDSIQAVGGSVAAYTRP
jgi:hypothetical protein